MEAHKGALQRLELEQGPRDFHFPGPAQRIPGLQWSIFRLMDLRFKQNIWPVLMHQDGDWPCLTHLSIKGVKNWFSSRDMEPIETLVRSKLGDKLSVVMEMEPKVMDHVGMNLV